MVEGPLEPGLDESSGDASRSARYLWPYSSAAFFRQQGFWQLNMVAPKQLEQAAPRGRRMCFTARPGLRRYASKLMG